MTIRSKGKSTFRTTSHFITTLSYRAGFFQDEDMVAQQQLWRKSGDGHLAAMSPTE
ncbi:hypothetical protein IMZ48_04075 [Candidatus Bathyarchaeota archaeon]|nr:hypothetical protein [Candidatus Bathyarchaeota archaeon]